MVGGVAKTGPIVNITLMFLLSLLLFYWSEIGIFLGLFKWRTVCFCSDIFFSVIVAIAFLLWILIQSTFCSSMSSPIFFNDNFHCNITVDIQSLCCLLWWLNEIVKGQVETKCLHLIYQTRGRQTFLKKGEIIDLFDFAGPSWSLSQLLNLLFFKDFIFLEQFQFTSKWRGRYKHSPYAFCLHMCIASSIINISLPGWCICYNWWTYLDTLQSPKVGNLH